jgi:hypothetical protein
MMSPAVAAYFQSHIFKLRWCVEFGCIDIITEVSMVSFFLFLSHEGHLDNLLYAIDCILYRRNSRVVFGPTYHEVYTHDFIKTD